MRERLLEAIRKAKENGGKRRFEQTVELQISFRGINPRRPQERITGEVVLPHGCGKHRRICVFAEREVAKKAKEAGADLVLGREEIQKIGSNRKEGKKLAEMYDYFLAEPQLMAHVGRLLGRFLGPRGKVPRPITSPDLHALFDKIRRTVYFRMKDQPILSMRVGSESMSDEELADNIEAVLRFLETKLPRGLSQIKSMHIKLTMGKPQAVKLR